MLSIKTLSEEFSSLHSFKAFMVNTKSNSVDKEIFASDHRFAEDENNVDDEDDALFFVDSFADDLLHNTSSCFDPL